MFVTTLFIAAQIFHIFGASDKCTYISTGPSTSGDNIYHTVRLLLYRYGFINCKNECNNKANCKGFTFFDESYIMDRCSLYDEAICRNTSGTEFAHGVFYTCEASEVWSMWEEWSACSASCEGVRSRVSHCCPEVCDTSKSETENCNSPCPVDGGWSEWVPADQCSRSCGNDGVQTWTRNCSEPEPANGGQTCTGENSETRACNVVPCPVDGSWSEWASSGDCSESCGNQSVQMWTRDCTDPPPAYGGYDCIGPLYETRECFVSPCPVDGVWSSWTKFEECSHTCGNYSTQIRTRECTNPAPEYGGQNCTGSGIDTKICNVSYCPVDGGWSTWSSYSTCSVTCGNGTQERSRECSNPSPQYGGADCHGNKSEHTICITNIKCEDPVNLVGCHCECKDDGEANITIDEKIKSIVDHLSVKKSELSSTKNQKISASDPRLSSARIGYVGVLFIGAVGLLLICVDCHTFIKYLNTKRQ